MARVFQSGDPADKEDEEITRTGGLEYNHTKSSGSEDMPDPSHKTSSSKSFLTMGVETPVRRIFRTISWDGFSVNPVASAPANLAHPTSGAPAGPATPTSSPEDVWTEERINLLGKVQELTKQLNTTKSQLAKFAADPNWVTTLEQQIQSAADEHREMTQLVESLRVQIKETNQELTVMRLESLERGQSSVSGEHPHSTNGRDDVPNNQRPSIDPTTFGWGTSSRWESPEVREFSSASRLISVPSDEYRGIQAAKDTALVRAGELAHQLAQAQSVVDDLQERLELTSQRLQKTTGDSAELKSQNDALQSKVIWLERQLSNLESKGSSSVSGKEGVPTSASSRLAQLLTRTSPGNTSSFSVSNPLHKLSILAGPSPTVSDSYVASLTSPNYLSLPPIADYGALASSTENYACTHYRVDNVDAIVEVASTATPDESGTPAQSDFSDANVMKQMAAELFKLKQQVLHLQDEKAECLRALVASQNHVECLLEQCSRPSKEHS
jgi:predicted  nucleic acid-binding Zn-ribbon protein